MLKRNNLNYVKKSFVLNVILLPPSKKKSMLNFTKKTQLDVDSVCMNQLEVFSTGHPGFSRQPLQPLLSHGSDQLRSFKVLGVSEVESMKSVVQLLASSNLNNNTYLPNYSGLKIKKHIFVKPQPQWLNNPT